MIFVRSDVEFLIKIGPPRRGEVPGTRSVDSAAAGRPPVQRIDGSDVMIEVRWTRPVRGRGTAGSACRVSRIRAVAGRNGPVRHTRRRSRYAVRGGHPDGPLAARTRPGAWSKGNPGRALSCSAGPRQEPGRSRPTRPVTQPLGRSGCAGSVPVTAEMQKTHQRRPTSVRNESWRPAAGAALSRYRVVRRSDRRYRARAGRTTRHRANGIAAMTKAWHRPAAGGDDASRGNLHRPWHFLPGPISRRFGAPARVVTMSGRAVLRSPISGSGRAHDSRSCQRAPGNHESVAQTGGRRP